MSLNFPSYCNLQYTIYTSSTSCVASYLVFRMEECTHSSWQFKSVLVITHATLLAKSGCNEELVTSTLPPPGERWRQKEELVCSTAGVVTDRLKDKQHRVHADMQEGICSEPCLEIYSDMESETQGIQESGGLQTGIQETGGLQTGIQESGGLQTGIQKSGGLQTGIQELGELQAGIQETGGLQTGMKETGGLQTGIQEIGGLQTGIQETGGLQKGLQESGGLQTGIQESGGLQTGIQESGGLQTGIQESGGLQTGIQEIGELYRQRHYKV